MREGGGDGSRGELKEQEEAFRQQQLAAQVVRVQRERLRVDIEMLLRGVFLVL